MFEALAANIAVFLITAGIITVCGVRLSIVADRLADKTGWGEALLGGLFLAGVTSLPDFAATISAAVDAYAELALSNILGSLAINFAFLGVGDILYRKANLEHAAASSGNLIQAALLITLLTLPILSMVTPEVDFWGIHPVSPLLLAVYFYGYRMIRHDSVTPMWQPKHTALTVKDNPDKKQVHGHSLTGLWLRFGALAFITAIAGWVLMDAAGTIASETPLSETVMGTLFTALFTSMPELVTTITAIRYGALTLAVGNIIGTNCFNILVIAAADFAYRDGSIYHAVTTQQLIWAIVAILMTGILLLGFLRRERYGIAGIGSESFLILLVYGGAVIGLAFL